jgi:alpha,alpha-trehalase
MVPKVPPACTIVNTDVFLGERYGFVPNGSRIYYLNRSQPPLLSDMVKAVFDISVKYTLHAIVLTMIFIGASFFLSTKLMNFCIHCIQGDINWLKESVAILELEYNYWMSGNKRVQIAKQVLSSQEPMPQEVWLLNRYHATSNRPRPESYREDLKTASRSTNPDIFQELATAAESGWDFSSRWIGGPSIGSKSAGSVDAQDGAEFSLANISPTRCVPVDLNCFLYRMENNISFMHQKIGESCTDIAMRDNHRQVSHSFGMHAVKRQAAIESVLWDESAGRWRDAWLDQEIATDYDENIVYSVRKSVGPAPPYLSDFAVPLWAGIGVANKARQLRYSSIF